MRRVSTLYPGCRFLYAAVLAAALFVTLFRTTDARAACPADHIDETVVVDRITDGDTVRLQDGRRLRFIGIDTPELRHDGRRHEPFAAAAREQLQRLLDGVPRIGLRYDRQRQDTYGRTLAHLYLPDGRNIEAELLSRGLATALLVPPNDFGQSCYRHQEATARRQHRGIWSLPQYRVIPVSALTASANGFRRVSGTVTRVSKNRRGTGVQLDNRLWVNIRDKDRSYFADIDLQALKGRPLVVRGWLHARKVNGIATTFSMNIRHPAAIESGARHVD